MWAIRDECVYDQGTCPSTNPVLCVACVDQQQAHLPYAVWAMDLNNQWLVDHGSLATLDDIDTLRATVYRDGNGKQTLRVLGVILDTGYDTKASYWYCLGLTIDANGQPTGGRMREWVVPIKGDTGLQTTMGAEIRAKPITTFPDNTPFPGGAQLVLRHLHPKAFKDDFSDAMYREATVAVWFHQGIDQEYVEQVCGEVLRESKPDKQGNTRQYWAVIRRPQDQFDLAQYGFAARHMLHPQLMGLGTGDGAPAADETEQPKQRTPAPKRGQAEKPPAGVSYGNEEEDDDGWSDW